MSSFEEESAALCAAVCDELVARPEVWVRENKDIALVADRLQALGLPPMEIIPGSTIQRLGRLPLRGERDEDGNAYTLTLSELLAQGVAQSEISICLLSHVRHSDASADDELSSKAAVVAEFSDYQREVYNKTTYWWIDSVCSDAARTGAHTAALPLYVAASSVVAYYNVDDERYLSRAWTRLEVLLSAALSSPRSWRLVSPQTFTRESLPDTEDVVLLNPVEGELTHENERVFVQRLTEVAQQLWRVGKACNWHSEGNNYSEWNVPEELVPGQTEVFRWNMNHYIGPDDETSDVNDTDGANNQDEGDGLVETAAHSNE